MQYLLQQEDVNIYYIDLFCGAGGTSTGVELACVNGKNSAKVIACVNHDKNAIASHFANHPNALHFTEDIRTLDLSVLVGMVKKIRTTKPDAIIIVWASLECTNFSKAKGGHSRNADSRTLAEHLFRYIEAINPDYIQIENVEEFMCWGDLDENGKPVSRNKGRLYLRWINNVKSYGYEFDYRILNAADYGAYTSRKRFFGYFARKGLPIAWPTATHSKKGHSGMFGSLLKWKPVKEVLDFTDEGESIFTRKKSLSDKTLERIYSGLIKFVAGGKDNFLSAYYGCGKNFENRINRTSQSTDEPCGVLTTQNRYAKVQAQFISKYYSGHPESKNKSINEPADTITAIDHHSLISTRFLGVYCGVKGKQEGNVISLDKPSPTVTAFERLSLVSPKFIVNNYSGGGQKSSIESPCPAVMTAPKQNLVQCKFIDQQYGNSKPSGIDNPLGCITANPKYNLVSLQQPWIMNTNFNNVGCTINEPSQTITANRKWHYLMNPQYFNAGGSIENSCFTIIARMDKKPPCLISTETGQIAIEVYETDSEPMRKIKEFMVLFGIIDIKMRMLKIPELKRIMGFPQNYVLIGTQSEQKKYIGNAVEVNMARVLCEAMVKKLNQAKFA
ncbi:MAG: DNA cytosine methyltransferase [Tannerellaceae bacterium]|nr:DNA cytosine methyltransferase [Tannerellaceae bacterium]